MASLFDYITAAQSAGQKPSTGYSYRKTSSGKDVYTPVNANNRAQRLNINPGSMGGGRSNLDSQRGFSNQGMGIAGLNPSNRQPGLFGSSERSFFPKSVICDGLGLQIPPKVCIISFL